MRMTWDSGTSCRMIRVASSPFIRGIEMSMSTTFGRRVFAFSTASSPSTASPHTSQSVRDESKERRPRLTGSWSSTSRIRNGLKCPNRLPKRMQTSKASVRHGSIRHVVKLFNIVHFWKSPPHQLSQNAPLPGIAGESGGVIRRCEPLRVSKDSKVTRMAVLY